MSSFVGGKLKLKGGTDLKKKDIKKKKKKEKKLNQDGEDHRLPTIDEDAAANNDHNDTTHVPASTRDIRTEAERRFEERQKKLEEERLKKAAALSHKDKVKQFNERLARQTEHNDLFRTSYTA